MNIVFDTPEAPIKAKMPVKAKYTNYAFTCFYKKYYCDGDAGMMGMGMCGSQTPNSK